MAGKKAAAAGKAEGQDEPSIETRKGRKAFRRADERNAWQEVQEAAIKGAALTTAKRGRPSTYTPERGEHICALLSEGLSLRRICKMEGMPSLPAIWDWMEKEPSFASQYRRARELAAHALFDAAIDIADDASQDVLVSDDGSMTSNPTAVARAKLRVETRFKMAAKLAPKVYSDRLEGVQAGNINVQVNAVTVDARQLEPEQRDRLRQILLEARPIDER